MERSSYAVHMTWDAVVKLGLELPEVELGTWYRTPALKVEGRGFLRLKEDGASIVLGVEDLDAQAFLLGARPKVYFITDHYRGYPAVLARLRALTVKEARQRVREAWLQTASATLVKRTQATR
jgi:hypothetical protein